MGIGKVLDNPLGMLLGSKSEKAAAAPVAKDSEMKSAEDIAAETEAKKKAALLALNAGSNKQATTVGGGSPADVTKKTLLGL